MRSSKKSKNELITLNELDYSVFIKGILDELGFRVWCIDLLMWSSFRCFYGNYGFLPN